MVRPQLLRSKCNTSTCWIFPRELIIDDGYLLSQQSFLIHPKSFSVLNWLIFYFMCTITNFIIKERSFSGPLPPRPEAGPGAPVLCPLERYVPSAPPLLDSTDPCHPIAPVLDIYPNAHGRPSSSCDTPPNSTKLLEPAR